MKTIIRKKGVNSYRWHLMDHDSTVESGDHLGPLKELTDKLKKKREAYYADKKAKAAAAAERRKKEAAALPFGDRHKRFFDCRGKRGRPKKNAPRPEPENLAYDSVDNEHI